MCCPDFTAAAMALLAAPHPAPWKFIRPLVIGRRCLPHKRLELAHRLCYTCRKARLDCWAARCTGGCMSEAWYCRAFGQELGPMSFADLAVLVERKDVLPADLIKCGADGPWAPADGTPGLFAAGAKAPSSLFRTNSAADDAAPTNANSDDAELSVDEDESEKIATDNSPDSAASKPVDDPLVVPPSSPDVAPAPAGRRRLARIAAAAAALVLLGASAGGVTGWLVPAGASSPTSAAVNQQ